MKICLTTYDTQHRKTVEVFLGLHNLGLFEISLLRVPFSARPERDVLLRHRPAQFEGATTRALADAFDLHVYEYEDRERALAENDYFVICGANILEPSFANSGKIINGHAGLIPMVRGLDSFKWAILDGRPIGNTLHIINEEADSGTVLHQARTPLFRSDTIEEFALRHYQNEIWMLTHFHLFLNGGTILDLETRPARMRMPKEKEADMLAAFDDYKNQFAFD